MVIDITKYDQELRNLANSICRDLDHAKDIVQDTYIEALTHEIWEIDKLREICRRFAYGKVNAGRKDIAKPESARGWVTNEDEYTVWDTIAAPQQEQAPDISHLASIRNVRFLPFEQARKYVHTLEISRRSEWRQYIKSAKRSPYIPSLPHLVYKEEFKGYPDWFGPAYEKYNNSSLNLPWRVSEDILKKEKELGIGVMADHLPIEKTFASNVGWNKRTKIKFLPFEEARSFVRGLKMSTRREWRIYVRSGNKPGNIPALPHKAYGDIFQGYADWFGETAWINVREKLVVQNREQRKKQLEEKFGRAVNKNFLPFEEARAFVHSLNLKSKIEWAAYLKTNTKPDNIPAQPHKVYKKVFIDYTDWLNCHYFSYEEAVNYVRVNFKDITTGRQWKTILTLLPPEIPRNPNFHYRNKGWEGWGAFFGVPSRWKGRRIKYLSYEEAKAYVREHLVPLGINTTDKFSTNSKLLPDNIPSNPTKVYRNEWISSADFFGTDFNAKEIYTKKNYRSYAEAREWVRLNLRIIGVTSAKRWISYVKDQKDVCLPDDIPRSPAYTYKNNGWVSWGDFLGTLFVYNAEKNKNYWPYDRALKWMSRNMYKFCLTYDQWLDYTAGKLNMPGLPEMPLRLPPYPWNTYKDSGWVNLKIWLGKRIGKKTNSEQILSYDEAKAYVREHLIPLGINSMIKYNVAAKNKKIPLILPLDPRGYYKNRGWKGVVDFFGEVARRDPAKRKRKEWWSYEKAKQWIKENIKGQLHGRRQWMLYKKDGIKGLPKAPELIPSMADGIYKDSWKGWTDFLSYTKTVKNCIPDLSAEKIILIRRYINSNPGRTKLEIQRRFHIGELTLNRIIDGDFSGLDQQVAILPPLPPGVDIFDGKPYMIYDVAKAFLVTLEITTGKQGYINARKKGLLNEYFPVNPQKVYACCGWVSWRHFLTGYENPVVAKIAKEQVISHAKTRAFKFLSLDEARQQLKKLKLTGHLKYRQAKKEKILGREFPSNPDVAYKKTGWISWSDYLSTRGAVEFLSYEKAKEYLRSQLPQIKMKKQYYSLRAKRPACLPSNPHIVYGEAFKSWADFLGIEVKGRHKRKRIGSGFLDYEGAKLYVQQHLVPVGISDMGKWTKRISEIPDCLPHIPNVTYKKDWNVADFFGPGFTGRGNADNFWPYEKAKQWLTENVASVVYSEKTYIAYVSGLIEGAPALPVGIPKKPYFYYRKDNSWKSWMDFLGVTRTRRKPVESKPKVIMQAPVIIGGLPQNKEIVPGKKRSRSEFYTYEQARAYVREHLTPAGIITQIKYKAYDKRPSFLPNNPSVFYKTEWKGWEDFTGVYKQGRDITKRVGKGLVTYEEARDYVQQHLVPKGIYNLASYKRLGKQLPDYMPSNPDIVYRNKWTGPEDFFGASYSLREQFWSYDQIRAWFIENLKPHGITTATNFLSYKNGAYPDAPPLPNKIPMSVKIYLQARGEWKGWDHLLGVSPVKYADFVLDTHKVKKMYHEESKVAEG